MKKKIFGGIAVLSIAAIATFNVNLNTQNSDLSDLSLANVEALASETFTWDGKEWSDTFQYYNTIPFTSDWKPILTTCSTSWSAGGFYTVITDGKKVVCNNGEGNCITSSSCTQS